SDDTVLCPACSSDLNYPLGDFTVCSMCGHEWVPGEATAAAADAEPVVRDSVGNVLQDGDTVTVVKDLKVKGSPTSIKIGTKVRDIRLVNGVGDHDIDCKVDGFGPMQLKSSVVKKV
ncbi:MAG: zinc ribbon domain-containing protein YjdM, partial [Gaiellales bacterium]